MAGYCPDAPSYVECCLAPLCNNGDGYCGIWGPGSCNGGGDGHLVRYKLILLTFWGKLLISSALANILLPNVSDECPGPSDYKCCAGPFQ